MIKTYGADFRQPVTNMREYIQVAKSLLQQGEVDFDGSHYRAQASIRPSISDVPVIGSALGTGAFRACGEVADGAISWLCPPPYLKNYGLPALEEGARNADRTPPHPSSPTSSPAFTKTSTKYGLQSGRTSPTSPPPSSTSTCSPPPGFPGVSRESGLSDELIDSFTFYGDQNAIASSIQGLFDDGAGEVYASIVTPGPDAKASRQRTVAALSEINKSL